MIKEMTGDIFHLLDTGVVQAIAHGCNAQGAMGAGVAAVVSKRWPQLYLKYRQECLAGKFGPCMAWKDESAGQTVFNLLRDSFESAKLTTGEFNEP